MAKLSPEARITVGAVATIMFQALRLLNRLPIADKDIIRDNLYYKELVSLGMVCGVVDALSEMEKG